VTVKTYSQRTGSGWMSKALKHKKPPQTEDMNESKAVTTTKPDPLRGMISGDEFRRAVSQVLPKHLTPDRFVRIAILAMTRTPKLAECEKASFFGALMTLSQLGIEPDGRRAHLIPFENRKRGVVECQLIVDYKGIAELVQRSGLVANLHADIVCEADEFEYDCGSVERHRIDFRKPRGPMYAVYAIARMKDGTSKCEVLSRDEVDAVRSRSRAANAGPWVTDYNEMAKKTVFRRLSKWLPWSPEIRDAIEKDEEPIEVSATSVSTSDSLDHLLASIPETRTEAVEDKQEEPTKPNRKPEASNEIEPWEKLGITLQESGYTWDDFKAWAVASKQVEGIEALQSFADLSKPDAERFMRAMKGLLAQLAAAKGGAK